MTNLYLSGGLDILSIDKTAHLPRYDLTYLSTHNTLMLSKLLQVFRNKDLLDAFLTAFGEQVQDLEDALWTILLKTHISIATGDSLDVAGKIVGAPREGRDDDDYRVIIAAQIKINQCSGAPEEILEILRILFDRGTFVLTDVAPAAYEIYLNEVLPTFPTIDYFDKVIQICRLGGVSAYFKYQDCAKDKAFRWSEDDDFEATTTEGFSDDYGNTGGKWTEVYVAGDEEDI